MAKNDNRLATPYEDLDKELTQNSSGADGFFKRLTTRIKENRAISYLKNHMLLRKTLIFYVLLIPIILLIVGGLTAPTRITYTDDQLALTHSFDNGTGSVESTKQTYSKDNHIMVFEFETNDYTSSISKGINANNLEWSLFLPPEVDGDNAEMNVIPLTDNKIDVVVKGVPENFSIMIVRIKNKTTPDEDISVDAQTYDDYKREQEEKIRLKKKGKGNGNSEKSDFVDFYITTQNKQLTQAPLKNLSRENFALQVFNEELKFQKGQVKKLEKAITNLEERNKENQKTLEQLQREQQYLVGQELQDKQDEIDDVNTDIETKERNIGQAKENIVSVKAIIDNLEKNIAMVKNGTYEFNAPVKSIRRDIQ